MNDCRNCVYGWWLHPKALLCAAANGFVPMAAWKNDCKIWKLDRDKDDDLSDDNAMERSFQEDA